MGSSSTFRVSAPSTQHTVGLIGATIARSLSPAMQNAAFLYHDLPDRYTLWPVAEADVPAAIAAMRAPGMRGANITIPYKSVVLPLVDVLGADPDVRVLGALNTIVRRVDGTLLGLNTDVDGFLRALDAAGFKPRGARVVLLGAGGAARAVAWGLVQAAIESLALINRSIDRSADLVAMLEQAASPRPRVPVVVLSDDDVGHAIEEATLLVNATPVGADGLQTPIEPAHLHPRLLVCDLIYRSTPLLRAAEARGAATQDGLEMLVQQGGLAFEAWTGLAAPLDVMRRAALEARERLV